MYNMDDARAPFYLSILNPVPTVIMIVLESFVMVGREAGHESQHPAAPRGEEKLTKVATDEYSRHQARVTTLSALMAPTQPTFLAQCVLWQAGGLTERERGENILRITNLRRDDEEDDDPSRGAEHKHSPPSQPATAGDRIPNEFYNSDKNLLTL